MKRGKFMFNKETQRYDICFGTGDYYGGLHCGDCFEIFLDGKWVKTRLEMNVMNNEWYLVGIPTSIKEKAFGARI